MKKHRVVALAYDQLCTFEFGCVVELFALERPELGVNWYEFFVCASEVGEIKAAGGIKVSVPYSLEIMDKADTIIVPGWRDADERPPQALLNKIQAAFQRGARICSICSGVFVLAAAGILKGKRATTHWRYADKLKKDFPSINVQTDALYIDEEQIITSAGSAAGLDMLLHLVRKDYGSKVSNRVAQRLVVAPHREGGQAQFVPRPMPPDEKGKLAKLMDSVRARPSEVHTIKSMAQQALLSPRTLQRYFNDTVGMSPIEWLIKERVAIAKELLESPHIPLVKVAALAGFGSEESFRRHFRQHVATTPSAYRQRFCNEE